MHQLRHFIKCNPLRDRYSRNSVTKCRNCGEEMVVTGERQPIHIDNEMYPKFIRDIAEPSASKVLCSDCFKKTARERATRGEPPYKPINPFTPEEKKRLGFD